MSIVAVGFLAYDTVETPGGKVEEVLGGGASYFAIAAQIFFSSQHRRRGRF